MRLYDSHCHLDFPSLRESLPEVLGRAYAAGVSAVLVPGVDDEQVTRGALLRAPPEVRLLRAVGAHPCGGPVALEQLAETAIRLGAVAIGELGWDRGGRSASEQDANAVALLMVAKELSLPVIVHVVGRHGRALEQLERWAPLAGVVHAYSGSAELVSRYVALGLHLSLGPSVLRPGARRPLEAARAIPADRLLIETDAPDQTAEPADLARVCAAVAGARGETAAKVASLTWQNACALFEGG